MEERNMPRADLITSIILFAFGIAVLVLSIQMPRFEEEGVNRFSVPGIVPGFLGAIVAVLGVVLFIRSIIRKGYKLGVDGAAVSRFFKAEITKRFAVTILVSRVTRPPSPETVSRIHGEVERFVYGGEG